MHSRMVTVWTKRNRMDKEVILWIIFTLIKLLFNCAHMNPAFSCHGANLWHYYHKIHYKQDLNIETQLKNISNMGREWYEIVISVTQMSILLPFIQQAAYANYMYLFTLECILCFKSNMLYAKTWPSWFLK